jgi:hypothetical protein
MTSHLYNIMSWQASSVHIRIRSFWLITAAIFAKMSGKVGLDNSMTLFLRCLKLATIFVWKSFHLRQNCCWSSILIVCSYLKSSSQGQGQVFLSPAANELQRRKHSMRMPRSSVDEIYTIEIGWLISDVEEVVDDQSEEGISMRKVFQCLVI